MKRSTGSFSPRLQTDSRRAPLGGRRVRRALGGLTVLVLLGSGCVLPGIHREVVDERDRLAGEHKQLTERVTLLAASNQSLSGERVELIGQVEDLRDAREDLESERGALEAQVAELAARRGQLEAELAARDAQAEEEQHEVVLLRGTYDGLVQELQSEVAAGRIEIELLREGIRVKLAQEILFPKGSARVSAEGRDVLRRVAARLVGEAHRIEVQGHTDDLAIRGRLAERFPTNWELGGARAARVVRILESAGVPSEQLRAVSYGPHRPLASNRDAEGRARNRRIEIRLVPEGLEAAPPPAAGAAPLDAGT